MLNPKKLEQFAQQIHDALPQGVKNFGGDMEAKVKQVIQAQLAKLDVVTREDFEVQTQVLIRTREKLGALEQRLQELESKLLSDEAQSAVDSTQSTE
ncbi:ubiquinone biosynthesis accessory factor UbiK [Testudinibacter sp. TR-2022]|uniref:ubiquinone biosynthesis accessory factor UbiK n=1 Tax=Testudinibacter sp. TR-2022 TaxID=2585029 RepID=UPI00111B8049|nr:accessory factor UbiK family protein [Testudinibacter sp. TR-2022]TNH07852.1 accessory factor UbiK family protein [Pasteurellaceae bacterium Phil11]TNH24642.1 accessory factor UbiK family protein [Testudinibacter sp. TR-2022]TNH28130.1 accessory factor UbiK family protein [Testudinibacter sp. TR-2022]